MAWASRIFILMLVLNSTLFLFSEVIGKDDGGSFLSGYDSAFTNDTDMFGSGIVERPNIIYDENGTLISATDIDLNRNRTSEDSIVPDIDSTVEPNSAFRYSTIAFGWTMIKKSFSMLFKFMTMPLHIFSTEFGFSQEISFMLQILIGLPLTLAFLLSLVFVIFGRASW